MSARQIVVLCGGCSAEREVSLRSGAAVARALPGSRLEVLAEDALPSWLDPSRHVILPMLHGGWGEGGGLQSELEARGLAFAGSDAVASRLCMDKVATKARLRSAGLPVAEEVAFPADQPPRAAELLARLGPAVFVKPVDQGSSVGLRHAEDAASLERILAQLSPGRWMAEPRLSGRELTVGLLEGRVLGVVEILASAGVYDYQSKYAPGGSRHLVPAPLPPPVAAAITRAAEAAFRCCGCRDFARVDVILAPDGAFHILEVNTLPGMTETSLLPDCAACQGLSYAELAARMAAGALRRATPPT